MEKKYKSWQLKTIDFMAKKCINNGGIFLYHYMGTGKSLTSLGIAQNLGLDLVILCPDMLVNQWKTDYIDKYREYLDMEISIFGYKDAIKEFKKKKKEWFEDKTLIFDEVHNFESLGIDLSIFYLFKRRIVLTGTPITHDTTQIASIINIASGETIFPLNKSLFIKKFYVLNKKRAFYYGFLAPSVIYLQSMIVCTSFINMIISGIESKMTSDNNNDHLQNIIKNLIGLIRTTINSPYSIPRDILLHFINFFKEDKIKLDEEQKKFYDNVIAVFFSCIAFIIFEIQKEKMKYSKFANDDHTMYEPNLKKIKRYIGNNISFYKPDLIKDDFFPIIEKKEIMASYTMFQMDILMRYCSSKLLEEDYLSLDIFRNFDEIIKNTYDQNDGDLYLKYGRMIGNACNFYNIETKKPEYLISNIVSFDDKKLVYTLNKDIELKELPKKYAIIIEEIKKNPNKKIVIYSSFHRAFETLSACFSKENIKHFSIRNDISIEENKYIFEKYYNNTINVLILDNKYNEGISINETNYFYILEPLLHLSTKIQTEARIVRLDSHEKGSKVCIINLISNISYVEKETTIKASSIKNWFNYSKYESLYDWRYLKFDETCTPDRYINFRISNSEKQSRGILEVLKEVCIENNKISKKCIRSDCIMGNSIEKKGNCSVKNKEFILKLKSSGKSKKKN